MFGNDWRINKIKFSRTTEPYQLYIRIDGSNLIWNFVAGRVEEQKKEYKMCIIKEMFGELQ